MWKPMPQPFVPAATPAARNAPRDLPQHGTGSQRKPLHQVHHMAMGRRLTDTSKPRHPLAGRGAQEPRPTDRNARGPNRALLQFTMKPTAQFPTALEGEIHFIVEELTDDTITLATNMLAAVTDTWDYAVGHPTGTQRQDSGEEGHPDTGAC